MLAGKLASQRSVIDFDARKETVARWDGPAGWVVPVVQAGEGGSGTMSTPGFAGRFTIDRNSQVGGRVYKGIPITKHIIIQVPSNSASSR